MKTQLNIAHRGASAYAPENTFAAYDLALSLGADAIELDVRETRDGELVVLHDETVDRTTRGRHLDSTIISGLNWKDLADRDAGSWFNDHNSLFARPEYEAARIPRLRDVFERYGHTLTYFIELKHAPCNTGMEEKLVDVVRRFGLSGQRGPSKIVVEAFSQPCLQKLRALDEDVALVQLFHAYATGRAIRSYLVALPSYCTGIGPCARSVESRLVDAAHLHGLHVYAWTVNDPLEMRALSDLEVDGIVTDFPDLLDDTTQGKPRRSLREKSGR